MLVELVLWDASEIAQSEMKAEFQKAILMQIAFPNAHSERLYVLSLQPLGAFRNIELDGLPFLKTLEPTRLDC